MERKSQRMQGKRRPVAPAPPVDPSAEEDLNSDRSTGMHKYWAYALNTYDPMSYEEWAQLREQGKDPGGKRIWGEENFLPEEWQKNKGWLKRMMWDIMERDVQNKQK